MEHYIINIKPMAAVRMTGAGKWVKDKAQRYLAYKTDVAYQLIKQKPYEVPLSVPVEILAVFYMPIPDSDSNKEKERKRGQYCTKRPDIDNLIKGLYDSANGILWKDDNLVVKSTESKIYDDNPRIELFVKEV